MFDEGRRAPRALVRSVWVIVGLLIIVGVVAAGARSVFVADLISRIEPGRQYIFDALDRNDPFASERAAEVRRVDGRYASRRGLTLLHVVPGGLLLLLAPLQFSRRVRERHIGVHRWAGRAFLISAVLTVLPGMYFGLVVPYGGAGEAVVIGFASAVFLGALGGGFVAIRQKRVRRHREWMLRAFAVAIGVATVRIVAIPLDLMLTPAGYPPADVFVIALWTGWVLTMGGAELWIRYTRPRRASLVELAALPEAH